MYRKIPEDIRRLKRWVCAVNGDKCPYRAFEPYEASATKAETWSDFETAVGSVDEGHYDYVGFVFAGDGIVGIDIDDGFDEDGFISEKAADIIDRCRSYTETSRSGRGFHILVRGSLPFSGRNNRDGVEIYSKGRYFILTGKTLVYEDIREDQEAIDYVVGKYFPEAERNGSSAMLPRFYTPEWKRPQADRISLRPEYPPIERGGRNLSLLSVAGAMRREGFDRKYIVREVSRANKNACIPPLSDDEVLSVVRSAMRYKRAKRGNDNG